MFEVDTVVVLNAPFRTGSYTYDRERIIPKGFVGKIEAVGEKTYTVYFAGCPFGSGRFEIPFGQVEKHANH